jgi:hypothetical protein
LFDYNVQHESTLTSIKTIKREIIYLHPEEGNDITSAIEDASSVEEAVEVDYSSSEGGSENAEVVEESSYDERYSNMSVEDYIYDYDDGYPLYGYEEY